MASLAPKLSDPLRHAGQRALLHGEVLAAMGRDDEALQWFASLGSGAVTEIPLQALAILRQAEIHDRLGNHAQAARHYARFLALWRGADAEFQPLVATARRRLASLTPPGSS